MTAKDHKAATKLQPLCRGKKTQSIPMAWVMGLLGPSAYCKNECEGVWPTAPVHWSLTVLPTA